MPLPAGDLFRVTVGGAAPSGENWSVGAWYDALLSSGTPGPADMNTIAAYALAQFQSNVWGAGGGGLAGNNVTGFALSTGKAYWYRNGVISGSGSAAQTATPGTGSSPQPQFTAQVVTLGTDTPGRSHRGRMYLPMTSRAPSGSTGLWPANSTLLNGVYAWLAAMRTNGIGWSPMGNPALVVVSSTHGLKTIITQLRMDNKPDTQRGREKRVAATVIDTHAFP